MSWRRSKMTKQERNALILVVCLYLFLAIAGSYIMVALVDICEGMPDGCVEPGAP